MNGGLKIGELARRVGVTPKAIRFYERKRVLPLARRAPNGYRLYGDEAVEMLGFVKRATGLGLTLAEVRDIIAIHQRGRAPCTHIQQLLLAKTAELNRKLEDLLEVRRRIRRRLAAWKRLPVCKGAVCPNIPAVAALQGKHAKVQRLRKGVDIAPGGRG